MAPYPNAEEIVLETIHVPLQTRQELPKVEIFVFTISQVSTDSVKRDMENKTLLNCDNCGVSFERPTKEVRRRQKAGCKRFFCNLKCSGKKARPLLPRVQKQCPHCKKVFTTIKGSHEKASCSKRCSNAFFKRGGALKISLSYRGICWRKHKKECVICGENQVVAVHHYDEVHTNNAAENLIPLCPTHHTYVHTKKLRKKVIGKIEQYRQNFMGLSSKQ